MTTWKPVWGFYIIAQVTQPPKGRLSNLWPVLTCDCGECAVGVAGHLGGGQGGRQVHVGGRQIYLGGQCLWHLHLYITYSSTHGSKHNMNNDIMPLVQ